ncbi:MAG: tetratricopeptide repeat protein [Gemmatimonadota bacterium]|jgi:tol-pal system protein YbgF|nr:tetratricopeptide repeat protein [Gemmatimonadota bacterium]
MRKGFLVVALLVAPVLTGCATKQDMQTLQTEIRQLQTSLLRELNRQNAMILDSLSVQDFRQRGDFANQMLRLERNLVEIQELTGQSQRALTEFQESLRAREEAQRRLVDPSLAANGDADDLFSSAEGALQRGSVATARVAFEEFTNSFPDHPRAREARLFLGNIYATEGDVERALEQYAIILSSFPDSSEAPTALFQAALVERGRGNKDLAANMLNQLTAAYPSSPEAAAARDELRQMR